MVHLPLGIRKKITLSFYFLLSLMIGTAFLTYGIVMRVEQKVQSFEVIDNFLNTTLELRRFEKNYFLFNKYEDFQENMVFWQELETLLVKDIKTITSVLSHESFKNLWDRMHEYKESMRLLYKINQDWEKDQTNLVKRPNLEERIRSIGKELTEIAEKTSTAERKSVQNLLRATGRVLIISIVSLIVLCIIIATVVSRYIVRSLKVLEDHTKKISRGQFVAAAANTADQEINSLLQAFNKMTNELRIRQQQLVQSEKLASLGTLLSGVAHELNNPLSNISTSAQILAEEIESADPEFKNNLIKQVMDQSDRARDIVRTLLEFSRIREFNKQKILFRQLIDETILLLRGQVPSNVTIELEIPDNLEIVVDKPRMQQVCLNLIKNAVDVLKEDGHIWITGREIQRGRKSREVEILIEDDGPGIPPELLNRIFDPFFTTKDVGHGSGLGLFIVHDIIEWHGGSIQVDSRVGEGTTFIIWLPITNGE